MLDFIRPFVERGFALHWLHPESKRPKNGRGWSEKPFASFTDLRKTYTDGDNVGVRPGELSKIGEDYLHVIDLDIRVDPDGLSYPDEARAALQRLFPDIQRLPRVASGSGGDSRHYYFLTDKLFDSKVLARSAEKFTDAQGHKHNYWEIELFGTGKQLAMPPSIHPDTGRKYKWEVPFDFDALDAGDGPFIPSEDIPVPGRAASDGSVDDDDTLLNMAKNPRLNIEIEEIAEWVMSLPVEEWADPRDNWLRVGMAIHHETMGSMEGLDVWREFSRQSTKFDEANLKRVWRSFEVGESNPVTMASIKATLTDNGAELLRCQKKLVGVDKFRKALKIVAKFDLSPTELSTVIKQLKKLAAAEGIEASPVDIKRELVELKAANVDPEVAKEQAHRRQVALEAWVAQEFLAKHFKGDQLLRIGKVYWRYVKGCWRMTDDEYIDGRIFDFVTETLASKTAHDEKLGSAIIKSGRSENLNALLGALSGIVKKYAARDSGADVMRLCRVDIGSVMNCVNGELWFDPEQKRPQFRDHDPDNRLTMSVGANYDPEAECPEWDRALKGIFRDAPDRDDVIDYLHEIMGYALQTERSLATWVMFHGSGANGKSFVTTILQRLLGVRSWSGKSLGDFGQKVSNPHIEAALVGKLLLVDDDFAQNAMLPDSALKKFSEAKMLTANPKYAGEFNFACRAMPMLLTNHWPRTSDSSFGLHRRAQVIAFNRTFTEDERDLHLADRITADEMSGVLNRCIAGWKRLRARGKFAPPVSCQRAKNDWMNVRNAMSAFTSDCLMVTKHADSICTGEELWATFQRWEENEGGGTQWSRRRVMQEIAEINGVEKYLSMGVTKFRGVEIVFDHPFFDNLDEEAVEHPI